MQRRELFGPSVLSADAAADCGAWVDLSGDYRGCESTGRFRVALAIDCRMVLRSVVIAVWIYLSYRFAERIGRTLGHAAMNVIIRLSSFILLCIGVQIMWNGLSALLRTVVP